MRRSYRTSTASRRLAGWDYATGGPYFLTLCVAGRLQQLGSVIRGDLSLSRSGWIVSEEWRGVARIRPGLILDEFVVMPDHFHASVTLPGRTDTPPVRTEGFSRPKRSLGSLVAQFKACTTRRVNTELGRPGQLWQRNYYDRIIRDETELERIRDYIRQNPARWVGNP